jgi:hypothetical protein
MGTQYLGGFIGDAEAQHTWVKAKTKDWADTISELVMVTDSRSGCFCNE